jgi:hypothetical protein
MPIDDWTFWTLVACAVVFGAFVILGIVCAITH